MSTKTLQHWLGISAVCVVCLILNVSGFATGCSFCVTNIKEANMEPFLRRATIPKPNYIVLPNHQSGIACICTNWGNKPECCSVDWKNILHFFPLNGVSWTTKNENSFRASFVVCFQHFPNTSEGSFPFLQFNTCVILLRGSDVVYRWEFIDCRRAPQDPYIVKTL